VAAGGPLLVNGTCTIIDASGTETTKEGMFALCRCGESKNKPYCDGGHKAIDFDK
jgi:CDGSH-type Zn-finger protein